MVDRVGGGEVEVLADGFGVDEPAVAGLETGLLDLAGLAVEEILSGWTRRGGCPSSLIGATRSILAAVFV